jgi:hypothetical protein
LHDAVTDGGVRRLLARGTLEREFDSTDGRT